jgi:hypothetical protein
MIFKDIFLLPYETKLLREMADDKERRQGTPGLANLRLYELVSRVSIIPTQDSPRSFQIYYRINETGKRFLCYLDGKESINAEEKAKSEEVMNLTKQGVSASKIAAIASIISAILAAAAIVLTAISK